MFKCGYCGIEHQDIPTDLAYRRPIHYFLVPEEERATRCKDSEDILIVDDSSFAIRGVLEIPITDQPPIRHTWGLWAAVSRRSFERYMERYEEDAFDEPRFKGLLAVSPNGYPDLLDVEVQIQLRGSTERPLFLPGAQDHPLFAEHRAGITMARWHEIVRVAMPWLFS